MGGLRRSTEPLPSLPRRLQMRVVRSPWEESHSAPPTCPACPRLTSRKSSRSRSMSLSQRAWTSCCVSTTSTLRRRHPCPATRGHQERTDCRGAENPDGEVENVNFWTWSEFLSNRNSQTKIYYKRLSQHCQCILMF